MFEAKIFRPFSGFPDGGLSLRIVLHFPLKESEQCQCRYDMERRTAQIRTGLLRSV
jgi:hypothetical protein